MENNAKNNDNLTEIEKDERILEEKKRLTKLFTKMPAKVKKAVQSLIDNAAFMAITLEDLMSEINKKGVTEEYQNGANQKGVKKSSEVEVYNTMIKNHMGVMKQLTDLIPDKVPKSKDDGFAAFVTGRDDL